MFSKMSSNQWSTSISGQPQSGVINQWSTRELASTECDQRLLASEIGSDQNLNKVWTMI